MQAIASNDWMVMYKELQKKNGNGITEGIIPD